MTPVQRALRQAYAPRRLTGRARSELVVLTSLRRRGLAGGVGAGFTVVVGAGVVEGIAVVGVGDEVFGVDGAGVRAGAGAVVGAAVVGAFGEEPPFDPEP